MGAACVFGALLSAATAFALPAPTGPYAVGTTGLTFRRGPSGHDPAGTFSVRIWYPSRASFPRAPYGAGVHSAGGWVYRLLVRTHAGLDVQPSDGSFPIVLYVAGWGGRNTDNTALVEELASHGYVVAALSDVAFDVPPLEDLSKAADLSSHAAFEATLRRADAKIEYERQRASNVLDRFAEAPAARRSPYVVDAVIARTDLRRAGIFGYSLGGAVALAACRNDSRFKAAMNMDGWLFGTGRKPVAPGDAPYFLISDGVGPPSHADLTSDDPPRRYAAELDASDAIVQPNNLSRGGYALDIVGAKHADYTDAALYSPFQRLRATRGAPRVAELVRRYTVAFFDSTLEGRDVALLAEPVVKSDFSLRRWVPAVDHEGSRP